MNAEVAPRMNTDGHGSMPKGGEIFRSVHRAGTWSPFGAKVCFQVMAATVGSGVSPGNVFKQFVILSGAKNPVGVSQPLRDATSRWIPHSAADDPPGGHCAGGEADRGRRGSRTCRNPAGSLRRSAPRNDRKKVHRRSHPTLRGCFASQNDRISQDLRTHPHPCPSVVELT